MAELVLTEKARGELLATFVSRLIRLRHDYSIIRSGCYLYGKEELATGLHDVDWLDERGQMLSNDDWNNAQGRALVMRRASRRLDGSIEIAALLLNGSDETLQFALPGEFEWRFMLDSAAPEIEPYPLDEPVYDVQNQSAVIVTACLKAAAE